MNERVFEIEISGIRKFFNKVASVDGALSLTLGQPDFNTPKSIKEGMIKAINENKTTYTSNSGLEVLREKISEYLKRLGINYDKDNICITVGGSEGLFSVLTALVNEGDGILIPSPAYPAYESIVKLIGGKIVNYKLNDDFTLNIKSIEDEYKKTNSKILILSFPSNPTGAVLSKKDRDELVSFIERNDILVLTDEIYSSIIFGEYYSVAQIEKVKEKIIYVSGFSKMISATGLRLGFFCSNKEVMKEVMKVHQYAVSCANSIAQWGVYYGFDEALIDLHEMKETFKRRRDYCLKRLNDMGLKTSEANGAFYLFPSIQEFNMKSEEFCDKLLYEGKVACVPGKAFGDRGEGFIRISYCYSEDELKEALDRLETFIEKLKSE